MPETNPDWLTSKHEGKLPCLMHKGDSMTDSLAIAEFIEKTYPHNSLTRQGAFSYQEVLEKTSGFFPALSAFIKNKDESKEASLEAAVEAQLDNLDEVIRIIREDDEPKEKLIKKFKLTDTQAEAILNMRLRSLRKLEEVEIKAEHTELTAEKKTDK